MSRHRNPRMAGREAVEMALKNGDIEKPDFVFQAQSRRQWAGLAHYLQSGHPEIGGDDSL
jgi:hypothetical protein